MERTRSLFFALFLCSVVLSRFLEGVSAGQYGRCTLNNTSFTLSIDDPQSFTIISVDTDLFNNLTLNESITCYWKLNASPGHFVKILFTKFQGCAALPDNCSHFYFEAREGRNESGPLIKKMCNGVDCGNPKHIYSIGTDLFVKFHFKKGPKDDDFYLAFIANVSAVRPVSSCTPDNDDAANNNIILKGSQGTFTTPYSSNYHGYPPGTECTWKLFAPPGYIIKVEFTSFVLTSFEDCDVDRVHFFDGVFLSDYGHGFKVGVGKYCGQSARTTYSITSGLTVYFLAGLYYLQNVPRDGFVARYQILKQESTGPCTDNKPSNQMSGQGGTLITPNFPYNYPKFCTWIITPLKGQRLRFSISRSVLAPYLEVRRGATATGTLVGQFSAQEVVIYANDSLWIKFVSTMNSHRIFSGFIASYESIAKIPRVCSPLNNATTNNDFQLSDRRGFFRSPYYPGNYSNKCQCTWKIKGPPGKRIKFTLNDIDLGAPSDVCLSDYLQIRNGLTEDSPLQGNYCKAKKNQVIYSEGSSMWIRFHAGSNETFKGFDANYEINDLCDRFNSRDVNNDIRFNGSSGNFSSPNYPENYPVGITCTWKITVPAGKRVKLTFSHFSVDKKTSDCGSPGGFITVYNGIGTQYDDKIGDYCGESIPEPIYSKDNTMSVYFQSLTGKATSGFKAQFSAAAPINMVAIIGGVVGAVILLAIIGLLVYIFAVRKRRRGGHVRMH